MKEILFTGSGVAIVTPFHAGAVNFPAFGRLIDRQIDGGTDAIIVCGTTGEAATMTQKERMETIDYCVDRVAGRVPVIAGTGANDTQVARENALAAERLGVDGLLIVTPYYNKATQQGLLRHYKVIADSVYRALPDLPWDEAIFFAEPCPRRNLTLWKKSARLLSMEMKQKVFLDVLRMELTRKSQIRFMTK